MTFGDRLRRLRMEREWTQAYVGKQIGVSDRVVGYYEADNRFPKDENTLKALADLFNVSTDYLLGLSDKKKPSIELSKKDMIEIDEYLNKFENELLAQSGLMFDGEPMTQESREKLISAMRIGAEMAKKEAKEKFTPNKYRNQ